MQLAAWQDMEDIGYPDYCNKLPGAAYASSAFNFTGIPFEPRFGLCLPEECKLEDFNSAEAVISKVINGLPNANLPGVP